MVECYCAVDMEYYCHIKKYYYLKVFRSKQNIEILTNPSLPQPCSYPQIQNKFLQQLNPSSQEVADFKQCETIQCFNNKLFLWFQVNK